MNVMQVPDSAAYKQYSTHFAPLISRYGMQVAALLQADTDADGDPASSLLCGELHSRATGQLFTAHLISAIYFPSSQVFKRCWSDEAFVADGYPLRAPMVPGGFDHLWWRCSSAP